MGCRCCNGGKSGGNPDCSNPGTTFGDCGNFSEILECIGACGGAAWKVKATFANAHDINWDVLDHEILIRPGIGSSMQLNPDWYKKWDKLINGGRFPFYSFAGALCDFNISGYCSSGYSFDLDCDSETHELVVTCTFGNQGSDECGSNIQWKASARFPMPVTLPRCFSLTPDPRPNGVEDEDWRLIHCGGDTPIWLPQLSSLELCLAVDGCRNPEGCTPPSCPHVPPTAHIDVTQFGNCGFRLHGYATPGSCGGNLSCFWSNGRSAPDCDDTIQVNLTDTECGGRSRSYTFYAVDEYGCVGSKTVEVSCDCCCGGGGSLSATQLDEDGCLWEVCASVANSGDCTGTPIIVGILVDSGSACETHTEDCICDPDSDVVDCNAGLGCQVVSLINGECAEVTLSGGLAEIQYQVFDSLCGCAHGDLQRLPLGPCGNCGSCVGFVGGMTMTVTGIGSCDGYDCGCEDANVEVGVDVAATGSCSGFLTLQNFTCFGTLESFTTLHWQIYEDIDGFWLYLEINLSNSVSPSNTLGLDKFLGATMPNCLDIAECVTLPESGFCAICDLDGVEICATAY